MSDDPKTADVLIVNALHKERRWVQRVFGGDWVNCDRRGTTYQVHEGELGGHSARVVAVSQLQMGMPHAAILTSKSLMLWSPKVVIMTGICAGVQGQIELGNLVIASKAFDYGSGKIVDGRLRPHFEPVMIDSWLWQKLEVFRHDRGVQAELLNGYPLESGQPEPPLRIRMGSMGCGAAVVADTKIVEGIVAAERKLLALDMESYAVALATSMATTSTSRVEYFVVKGVVDYADASKADDHHDFACYASAAFVKLFLERHYDSVVLQNA